MHRLSFDQEVIMSRLSKWIFPGGDYLTRADSRYPFRELACDKIIVTSGPLHYNTGGRKGSQTMHLTMQRTIALKDNR